MFNRLSFMFHFTGQCLRSKAHPSLWVQLLGSQRALAASTNDKHVLSIGPLEAAFFDHLSRSDILNSLEDATLSQRDVMYVLGHSPMWDVRQI